MAKETSAPNATISDTTKKTALSTNARWYAKGATKIAKHMWALDQSVALWGSESAIRG